MMDAVTEAHYRVQAVVIGDMGSIKAELGVHDSVGLRGKGWDM
jgi:hypothetical protein